MSPLPVFWHSLLFPDLAEEWVQHVSRSLDVGLQGFRWYSVRACCLAWLEGLDSFGDLGLAGRVDIDIQELGWWWDVWWGGRGWSVEYFLEVFCPPCSLFCLAWDGVSVLVLDGTAGVVVFPRQCPGYIVQSLHVSLACCSLCLAGQLLNVASFVLPSTFLHLSVLLPVLSL